MDNSYSGAVAGFMYGGMRVMVSPFLPVKSCEIRLSGSVDVSVEFRQDFNDWLLGRFGKDVHCYIVNGDNIVCSASFYQQLQEKARHE